MRTAKPVNGLLRAVDPVRLSARLPAAGGLRRVYRVARPAPVQLVGLCPRRRRLVAVAAATSTGELFGRLVALLGDRGLAAAVGRGLATAEVHRWCRTARGCVVEVYTLTADDFLPRHGARG